MFSSVSPAQRFQNNGAYRCPICRHGQIAAMPLMEAFGCNFCHQMFVPNFQQQSLRLADRSFPLIWYWNGHRWQGVPQRETWPAWATGVLGTLLIVLPTLLMGVSIYLFPPTPDSALAWFPLVWMGLTFIAHLGLVLNLMADFYQFPLWAYLRAIQRYITARLGWRNG